MTQEESYNYGIVIIQEVKKPLEKLEDNQYYALMVTDLENRSRRSPYDYVNFGKGYIGLERTDSRIYISKDFHQRFNLYRGVTVLVRVEADKKHLFSELTK